MRAKGRELDCHDSYLSQTGHSAAGQQAFDSAVDSESSAGRKYTQRSREGGREDEDSRGVHY